MRHDYRTCDICGEKIESRDFLCIYAEFLSNQPVPNSRCSCELDICSTCLQEIDLGACISDKLNLFKSPMQEKKGKTMKK